MLRKKMRKKIWEVLALLLCCFVFTVVVSAGLCGETREQHISGEIVTGFRILDIDSGKKEIDFTVYRGDYIKFKYPQDMGEVIFSMPALTYSSPVQPDPEKSPYFKMKETGRYDYSLGGIHGKITVVDLVRPNYTELTADAANELLQNIEPHILDVRTPGEYKQLHIQGSNLIPIGQLQARIGELEAHKHDDVFIYCATGNRSTVASRILADRGFKRIYNLRYGVFDWAKRGYPITKE